MTSKNKNNNPNDLNDYLNDRVINLTQDNRKSNNALIEDVSKLKFNFNNTNNNEGISNMKMNNEESSSANILDNLKQLMRQRSTLYT